MLRENVENIIVPFCSQFVGRQGLEAILKTPFHKNIKTASNEFHVERYMGIVPLDDLIMTCVGWLRTVITDLLKIYLKNPVLI